jgi:dienelactone hydrolase
MKEQDIDYGSEGRVFTGFVVESAATDQVGVRPGVLVLHGGTGLGAHERERAHMLTELGVVAFAPDLFGEVFESRAHGVKVITELIERPPALRARLADALALLRALPGVDGTRTAAIGFCFGGLAALELARSGADLRAVVSFHGGLSTRSPAAPGAVRAAVLACTGAADPFVTREHRAAFEDEMTLARADWHLHVYGGAQHGFTERAARSPGAAYDEASDRRSWQAMRDLLADALSLG